MKLTQKETFNDKDQLHSLNDEPALICNNGDMYWYKNDYIHRENDLPGFVGSNGTKCWYKNGLCHREDDKPAIVYNDGSKYWYKDGRCHRDNGKPAFISSTGFEHWYIKGNELNFKQIKLLRKIIKSDIKHLPWLLNEDSLLNCVIENRMNQDN
jgi:hypothetical protein